MFAVFSFVSLAQKVGAQFEKFLKQDLAAGAQKTGEELDEQLDTWEADAKAQLVRLTNLDPKSDLPESRFLRCWQWVY